ncbi:MAG: hypothetical protein HYX60_06900 [Legionella longbeachae]|nr:hypothetical protein [Legionella longbeachae]
MSTKKKLLRINVETLVLVAVWENPFIFQGCIKITELHENNEVLYYFRCQSNHKKQNDILNNDFSSDDYELTHLYNELGFIPLSVIDPIKEYALDMMKYALHITLREMISSRKLHFTSIDDIAMQAMINKIKPILNKELALPDDEHIGFAVAMDFSPQEEMGRLAVLALLNKLEN